MPEPNNENTAPTHVGPAPVGSDPGSTAPTRIITPPLPAGAGIAAVPEKKRRTHRWPWFLLGLVILLAGVALGLYFGYNKAIVLRTAYQEQANITTATQYFVQGNQALEDKKFDLARRYFERVLSIDPKFPGASEKLVEALAAQMATATPTLVPSPTPITPTPTPDTRSQDEKLNEARELYKNKEWDKLFATIDSLRTIDKNFHSVEIDGMLYMALRFRGIRKIFQEANLEGGIYDLTLAENISPLDGEAIGARYNAQQLLKAISFWGVDWLKVIDWLEPIANAFPNMRDNSGMTAKQRYLEALHSEADKLAQENKPCDAMKYYQKAQDAGVPNLQETMTAVDAICHPPTETPTITETPTVTTTVMATVEVTTPAPTAQETQVPPTPTQKTPEPPKESTPTPTTAPAATHTPGPTPTPTP